MCLNPIMNIQLLSLTVPLVHTNACQWGKKIVSNGDRQNKSSPNSSDFDKCTIVQERESLRCVANVKVRPFLTQKIKSPSINNLFFFFLVNRPSIIKHP